MGDAGEAHERCDRRDPVVHHGDVGGLDGAVRTAHAHGDADVGSGKRRGVVDAVARHGGETALLKLLDGLELVLGQQVRPDVLETDLFGERASGRFIVAREEPRADAYGGELAQALDRVLLHDVGESEDRLHAEGVGDGDG